LTPTNNKGAAMTSETPQLMKQQSDEVQPLQQGLATPPEDIPLKLPAIADETPQPMKQGGDEAQPVQQDLSNRPEVIPFHLSAEELTKKYAANFSRSLIRYAQNIAYHHGDEIVLTNHVKEAFEIIRGERRKSRWREFAIVFSSAFFGIFLQGFLSEMAKFETIPSTGSTVTTTIYGVFSIVAGIIATVATIRS
jgi:hypothetical protein